MLRIVVFDGGLGGDQVADYLATELKVVEVIREIDWRHLPYESYTESQIYELARAAVEPYIGYAELIVLGGYISSLPLAWLRQEFPEQRFIGMPIDYRYILNICREPQQIMFMANELVLNSHVWTDIQRALSEHTLIAPDCSNWDWQLDCGDLPKQQLIADLGPYFAIRQAPHPHKDCRSLLTAYHDLPSGADSPTSQTESSPLRKQIISFLGRDCQLRSELAFAATGIDDFISPTPIATDVQDLTPEPVAAESQNLISPDIIILLDTHLWTIRDDLQELFGYGVRVIDFRKQLLHSVCRELGLKGLDGDLTCRF